jgi:transcriptional regulator with XRE-family HTH domain
MTTRERPRDRGLALSHRLTGLLGRDIREARRGGGLSLRAAAASVGLDHSTFARIERNEIEHVSVQNVTLACTAVGLVLSARAYPAADAVRDAPQLRLLARFRARLPATAPWQTEVPLPMPGDLRALDGFTRLHGRSIGVEAETRLTDVQAVARKVQLKKRDGRLDGIVLLVSDTQANRAALALHREALRGAFPLDTRVVMAAIAAGVPPPADGIVVL